MSTTYTISRRSDTRAGQFAQPPVPRTTPVPARVFFLGLIGLALIMFATVEGLTR